MGQEGVTSLACHTHTTSFSLCLSLGSQLNAWPSLRLIKMTVAFSLNKETQGYGGPFVDLFNLIEVL